MKSTKHLHDDLHKQAIDWLLRLQAKPCPESDRQAFEYWLTTSPEHKHAYERIEAQWNWMAQFKASSFPARAAALSFKKRSSWPLIAYSTAAGLLLAAGLTAFSANGWYGDSITYQVAKGDKQIIQLADGSAMELNTDSEARVHYNRWRRQVDLVRGEAYFTVTHNPDRPFEVRAGNGRIRDIGTAFEVYLQAEQVIVAVEEGSVEVRASGRKTLAAGQLLSYNANGDFLSHPEQNLAGLTAWRQGKMVFGARRLADVLTEIGRYHDTTIRLQNPALAELKVSGTFHTDKLSNSLNAIAAILPVKIVQISEHEIVLKSSKAR